LKHEGYLSKIQDVPSIVLKAGTHFDSSRNQPFLTTPTATPRMFTRPSLSMMEPEAGFSDKKITFLVHFSQPATSSELNRRVFPPGYAGLLTSLEIQDPLFELEVAAVRDRQNSRR